MSARVSLTAVRLAAAALVVAAGAGPAKARAAKNLFTNWSFELGQASWRADKGGATAASFKVDSADAADGKHSALLTIGKVEEWGVQFGQTFPAGQRGKTYTFAAAVRAVGSPVTVDVQIERSAKPWDRVARGPNVKVTPEKWTELHVTFKVDKDFREGWFAYVSCTQANCRFRVDTVRLYEGAFVPWRQQAAGARAVAQVRLFDTGAASAAPLAGDAFAQRTGWKALAGDAAATHRFAGDAVLVNDKLAVVLRRRGRAAELYSRGPDAVTRRAAAAPPGAERIASVRVAELTPGSASLDVAFTSAGGKSARLGLALQMGQAFVETTALAGARSVRVDAPCRFAVLPDFFADDIVVDATELPVETAELPSDHFLMHLLGGRGAIVLTVRDVVGGDVRLALAGEGDDRTVRAAEIPYGEKGHVWLAVLAGEGIWHRRDVESGQAGKVLPLDWRAPYPAQWRIDWRKTDGLVDSWEMAAQRSDGRFTKYGWFGGTSTLPANRNRWTTVLGRFQYPCWLDRAGRGHLQPLKRVARFAGPALIYPINRVRETPLDRFTVVDVVRGTLGVGPCEYVLDVEGQKSLSKGRATCATRSTLNGIYSKRQQKAKRAEIERVLKDVMVFIRFIRSRIEGYVDFAHGVREYLAAQRQARPELAERLDELDKLARAVDTYYARRKVKIKTPDEAAKMVEEFRRTVLDDDGPDALKKCKRFTTAWVEIGGNQDELVGECRMAVKIIRQRAGLLMAIEPRLAPIAREIRKRSQKVLRGPASHEGARH